MAACTARRIGLALLAAASIQTAWSAAAAAPPVSLDECGARVSAEPESFTAWRCYWDLGRHRNMMAEVERHLDALLVRQPGNHRARLQLGAVASDQFKDRAEGLFRAAAEGFEASGEIRGAIYARGGLSFFYRMRARLEEARAESERMLALAGRLAAPDLLAEARIDRGFLEYERADYGASYLMHKQALLQEDLKPWLYLRSRALQGLAAACAALGLFDEARAAYEEQAAMQHEHGNLFGEAATRVNICITSRAAGRGTEQTRHALAQEALRIARTGGNREAEASALIQLGSDSPRQEAARHYEEALRIYRQLKAPHGIVVGLERVSFTRMDGTASGERASFAAIEEAIQLARRHGLANRHAVSLALRARQRWAVGLRQQAITESLQAIEAVEALRGRQMDDAARASGFTNHHAPYYELAARLLEPFGTPPSAADLRLSFASIERMRARRLLELIEVSGAPMQGSGAAAQHARREELLAGISAVQKRLLDSRLADADRAVALADLERLELQERENRLEIARRDPIFAAMRAPRIPDIERIQEELAPDEALISYQLLRWSDPAPVNWALIISRMSVNVVPLDRFPDLDRRVAFFSGIVVSEDPSERHLASVLHKQLLAPVLALLPEEIGSLIIIPDGPLHHLPFAALRAAPDAPPAGALYALSETPSVTAWMRWRAQQRVPPRVLALADPADVPMAPLPWARREAASVARRMGGESSLAVGQQASERMLRSSDLSQFGILHLAAHAVVNDERPQRSGLLLAGGTGEDGLVQPREIAALDLKGRLVVLSACRSASGTLLRGEGIMGLAHAFFQAGARSVLGSRWPVRDDLAAFFLDQFYAQLARGTPADEALRLTRQEAIRRRTPAVGWAGFELLGDGSISFTKDETPEGADPGKGALLMASLAFGGAALLLVASARRA